MKLKTLITNSYLIIIILVIAATLRFHKINQPFIDATSWRESDTASVADNFYRNNGNIFYPEVSWNGPGPSYQGMEFQTLTFISALIYRLVGRHDWVGRSVAVLFSLWGIFAFYQLVLCAWDKEHALASAAFLALLPGGIYIDRSFVPDPVMVALIITSVWCLVVYLQTERLHYLLLAAMVGTWGVLTKLPGLIVGLPMLYAIIVILGYKKLLRPKNFLTLNITAVLTLLPVLAYYLWARHLALTHPPYHFTGEGNWVWDNDLYYWLEQKYFVPKLYEHFRNWFWTTPVIFFITVGLFLPPPYSAQRLRIRQNREKQISKVPWLFHWWMLAFVIYYIIGAQQLVGNPTNLNIVNPAAAALAANAFVAITAFIGERVGPPVSATLAIIMLLLVGVVGYQHLRQSYYPYAKEGYKLGLALDQIAQPDDLVITIAQDIGDPVANYYSHRRGWVFPPATTWSRLDWWSGIKDDSEAIRLLEQLRAEGADWFGIVINQKNKIWKENPKLVEYIEQTFELAQESPEYVIYRIPSLEMGVKPDRSSAVNPQWSKVMRSQGAN